MINLPQNAKEAAQTVPLPLFSNLFFVFSNSFDHFFQYFRFIFRFCSISLFRAAIGLFSVKFRQSKKDAN